jgi:hypothetical protein
MAIAALCIAAVMALAHAVPSSAMGFTECVNRCRIQRQDCSDDANRKTGGHATPQQAFTCRNNGLGCEARCGGEYDSCREKNRQVQPGGPGGDLTKCM